MLQPDNVWIETWRSATPLPAYRQKRIFDDTKEAEKVLHFLAHLRPCELAMSLMPLLLHSAVERMRRRLSKQPLARVEGLLQDAMALLATVQQPSLDTLPLYQVHTQYKVYLFSLSLLFSLTLLYPLHSLFFLLCVSPPQSLRPPSCLCFPCSPHL